PKTAKEVFRYPFPGTWYLLPQVTKLPFDNPKVRRAVAHAIDRENVVKVAQGFALPAHAMIPPGVPGALDDPTIKAIQRFDRELEAGRDTRDQAKRLQHYARAEEILQTDVGYVPVAWFVRYGAAKPWVRVIEKNRQGELVVEGNAYVDMLSHLYIVERT